MPLYEYCCAVCNASEERLSSFSSPTEHDCPVCGKAAGMVRKVSAPAINFSGGGWYAQGYSDTPPCKAGKPSGKGPASTSAPPSPGPSAESCCSACPAMKQ